MKNLIRAGLAAVALYSAMSAGCITENYKETAKPEPKTKVASKLEKSVQLNSEITFNPDVVAWEILRKEIEPVQEKVNAYLLDLDELDQQDLRE